CVLHCSTAVSETIRIKPVYYSVCMYVCLHSGPCLIALGSSLTANRNSAYLNPWICRDYSYLYLLQAGLVPLATQTTRAIKKPHPLLRRARKKPYI
ncbi:hypothetical protein B296_00033285, partial [Ensete ventricosum]